MTITKIEFAVHMTCGACVEAVKKSLQDIPGITNYNIDLENKTVVVDTTLPTLDVQEKLESTGRKVVVRGYEGSSAGVAILEAGQNSVQGVVRFVQVAPNSLIIDGTIDGLPPGNHHIFVHECGDISQGCRNVGNVFNPGSNNNGRTYGDLGKIEAKQDGRAAFRLEDNTVKLPEIIGRSLVIGDSSNRQACGVIARSAGLFQNPKTICACDGVSLWDESNKPKTKLNL